MPKFRSLSEALSQYQTTGPKMQVAPGHPLASMFGADVAFPEAGGVTSGKVFRWGYSTWGLDPINGKSLPGSSESSDSGGGRVL